MKENSQLIFPTTIWGFILRDHEYQSSDYIKAIEDLEKTQSSVKKSNFGGYQTHDDLHITPIFRELVSSLEKIASKCLDHKAKITEMWGNVNYKYCYNATHSHGGILSGVFYLKVPKNSGRLILRNPAVRSDGHFLKNPDYSITPENFALIFFPSWLEHYVEQNLSDEKRISVSFNFGII
jgi:uncharacterized protein (TIGR02466 family)